MSRRPSFNLYASDWLASASVLQMSLAAEATYLRLLCHQWNQGVLPESPAALVRLTKCTPAEWRKVWRELEPHFPLTDGGRANPKLATVAADADAFSAKKREAGRRGNAKRWGPDDGSPPVASPTPPRPDVPSHPDRTGIAQRSQCDRTATDVRVANASPSSSLPTTPPPPSAAAEGSPPRGGGGGAGATVAPVDPVAALPWPDPESRAAARVLVAERGVTAAGLVATCTGWAETGLDADRGQPVGWAPVARAVRDFAAAEGKRWHSASFAGFVRSAVKHLATVPPPPTTAAAPVDGPRVRCAALLAADGWRAPVAAWAEALGVPTDVAVEILAAVVPAAEHAPVAMAVELLVSERERLTVGTA